ncbi:hypothetical protein SAMN06295967_102112 [Belliella buryatensis]|uniref:Adhesin domain-containing protein n=1 Tax=Belliella buryatensis TaxID=1500549 RepID=A0A239B3S0_9BACT|nr:hypothetical protein [Belliella buryatensis]SNS02615.1 hypothetical protein SAMN06295967_102112 [Belliella buryatensis]
MLRVLCLLLCLSFWSKSPLIAQISKEFAVEERHGYNLVHVDFNVYKGITDVKRKHGDRPIYIQSHLSKVNILPSFSHEIKDGVLRAQLHHRNVESETLGKSLSYKLFSSDNEDFDHKWDLGLSSNHLYDLNLYFGVGKANLDFSNIPVSNCTIRSASADIKLDYSKRIANSVTMDTMVVAINMGNLDAYNINYANAENMFFEINYGTLNLSFSEGVIHDLKVSAVIGAGKVNLTLPDQNQPYRLKIKSTPMCRTSLPAYLKDIGDKTYVSKAYKADAPDLVDMVIDISVGSLVVK